MIIDYYKATDTHHSDHYFHTSEIPENVSFILSLSCICRSVLVVLLFMFLNQINISVILGVPVKGPTPSGPMVEGPLMKGR